MGSVLSQDTRLGCGFDPQSGHLQEATDRCLSLSLPLFPFLSKISEDVLG